jgi:DNA replication protein DnaC
MLDDFLLAPMTDVERRDLLEVLEDRYGKRATDLTSQLPTKSWHESLGDQTIADAICDRHVHNAHVLTLRGSSMRRQKGLKPQRETQPTPDQPRARRFALKPDRIPGILIRNG